MLQRMFVISLLSVQMYENMKYENAIMCKEMENRVGRDIQLKNEIAIMDLIYFVMKNSGIMNDQNKYLMDVEEQKSFENDNMENEGDEQDSESSESRSPQQECNDDVQSLSQQDEQKQQSQESPPIVAAIKTMKFREKRGSNMQDLMKGNINRDAFWDRNCSFFGGDLRQKIEEEDESDYEASSSGRDQFDSDFDLTDSYPGKRGRKKGQKVKRRVKREGSGRPRGRPKKVQTPSDEESDEGDEAYGKKEQRKVKKQKKQVKDPQNPQTRKKIFKPLPSKSTDFFIILKATFQNKRGPKTKPKKRISSGSEEENQISSSSEKSQQK